MKIEKIAKIFLKDGYVHTYHSDDEYYIITNYFGMKMSESLYRCFNESSGIFKMLDDGKGSRWSKDADTCVETDPINERILKMFKRDGKNPARRTSFIHEITQGDGKKEKTIQIRILKDSKGQLIFLNEKILQTFLDTFQAEHDILSSGPVGAVLIDYGSMQVVLMPIRVKPDVLDELR